MSPTVVRPTEVNSDIKLVRLSLVPAREPIPALSYRLLPNHLKQKTDNAALLYFSATALCPEQGPEEIHRKIRDWSDLPVEQWDRPAVEEVLSKFSSCFHHIELATQRRYCQWEMPIEDGFNMQMLPLSTFRSIFFALQLQTRLAIVDGHTDQAIRLLQQTLSMGRNIARGATVIHGLVGLSISARALDEIENLIQSTTAPNLYWALTTLPDPLIDMQTSLAYEREAFFMTLPELNHLEQEVLTASQASALLIDIMKEMQKLGMPKEFPLQEFVPMAWVMTHYTDAKSWLKEHGYTQKRIETMPAAQTVLVYQKLQYLHRVDNLFKWFSIPYSQAHPAMEQAAQEINKHLHGPGGKRNIFGMLVPALSRIVFLQARLERDIAMLRIVEAVRLFAAEHSGQLPQTLSDITAVPIPEDPVTGKPFIFNRYDTGRIRLEAPAWPADYMGRPVYDLNFNP